MRSRGAGEHDAAQSHPAQQSQSPPCRCSEDGRELLRVEGVLSNVIRHYARLDGVRVPIATESVAKVKLAGMSKLNVRYEYESINGRTVSSAARLTRASSSTR